MPGFSRRPSNEIAKNKLVEGSEDLCVGACDRLDEVWR